MEVSRIRLIRNDVSVWLVYAGRGRRFLETFRQSRSVFLSLPGFNATESVFESESKIRQHLAMADAVNKYITGATNTPPNRRASSYSSYPYQSGSTEAKSFAAELGNINRLFIEAKVGDLILSPTVGHYDPYLIGEITHAWRKADDLEIPSLQNEVVPVRKVRWLNTALARRDFSPRVSRRLQNQHAITRLDDQLYEDIFQKVYPSFVWGERSKLDVFGDGYTGTDPLQPYPSALLLKYVIASVFAYEKGEFATFQSLTPINAIGNYYDASMIEEFGQNFNSPGKFSVIAALGSMSILASAGLIVATSDGMRSFDDVKVEAVESVDEALAGSGKSRRRNQLNDYVDSMEAVNWKKVQEELGEPSNQSMPLTLNNTVEVSTHKEQLNAR